MKYSEYSTVLTKEQTELLLDRLIEFARSKNSDLKEGVFFTWNKLLNEDIKLNRVTFDKFINAIRNCMSRPCRIEYGEILKEAKISEDREL